MTNNSEKSNMRQFWLRVLLAVGILWGGMPLLTLPLLFIGSMVPALNLFVVVFNGLTVAPACVLAFWRRRLACVWLSGNAVVIIVSIALVFARGHGVGLGSIAGFIGSVILAVVLDFMEIMRWPKALGPA
jgi:hypothetical protein